MEKTNDSQADSVAEYDIKLTDQQNGLNSEQVINNRNLYGINEVKKRKNTNIVVKFFKQFLDFMVMLLVFAGVLTLILAIVKPSHDRIEQIVQYVEVAVIFAILLVNAIFGVVQETKAEKDTEALLKLTSPNAKVVRNGQIEIIDTKDVVVGDLIVLEAGDAIAADAFLISSSSLESDESPLTGESLPVSKDANAIVAFDAPLGDRTNSIFSGCTITSGTAKAVVTNVGMQSEIGKIAKLINDQKTPLTPLQQKINRLSKIIGIFGAILCIAVFIMYIYLIGGGNWEKAWHQGIVIAISLSIAAIPEGLIAIVTIILSFGVKRMSKQNALIKRLPAVETLGSANVICSDKTGTLTQNKMTVVSVYTHESGLSNIVDQSSILNLIKLGTIANNASISYDENDEINFVGDPTETSIVQAAHKLNVLKLDLDNEYERVFELPFDSDRKLMSVIVKKADKFMLVTKGAIDSLDSRLSSPLSKEVLLANDQMSNDALRVLGVAYKELKEIPTDTGSENLEKDLIFVGLLGMIDPPREEATEAVTIAKKAGIRPVMITGDHINTASAIAKQLGILNPGQEVLSGTELSNMSDEQLADNIERYSVYARVSPSDKIRIVKAWQSHDKIVSMTGDGVNDAPALKAADLGCAMGITGTDVSKASSDMILTDDNFATIVNSVKMGRSIMANIKRVIMLLLITNLSGLISLFIGILILGINPMSSLQILWINVISETFPGIALGLNFSEGNLMRYAPLKKSAPIVDKKMWLTIFICGLFIGMMSIFLFYLGASSHFNFNFYQMREAFLNLNLLETEYQAELVSLNPNQFVLNTLNIQIEFIKEVARSGSALTFMFMGLCLSFNAVSLRSNHTIFIDKWKDNKYVITSLLISCSMIALITYTPGLNTVFNMSPYVMGAYGWLNILPYLLFLLPIIGFETYKWTRYHKVKKEYDFKGLTFAQNQTNLEQAIQKLESASTQQQKQQYLDRIHDLKKERRMLQMKLHQEL